MTAVKTIFRRAVCLMLSAILVLGNAACTSKRMTTKIDSQNISENVEVGDDVQVATDVGEYFLEVTEVGPDYLRGKDPDTGKLYKIPFDRIKALQFDEFSGAKTASAVGGALVAAYVIFSAAVVYATVWYFDKLGENSN